jgi:hypothetical protein
MNVFRLQREARARSHEATVARDRGARVEAANLQRESEDLWRAATERWRIWEGRLVLAVAASAVMCIAALVRWVA